MDKIRIKKIIAREGLIIVCLVLVSAVCFFLDNWQSSHISKAVKPNPSELRAILGQVKYIDEKHIMCPNGEKIEFGSKPSEEDIYWTCTAGMKSDAKDLGKIPDKQLLELAEVPMDKRSFMQRVNFSNWGLIFLFAVYPVYLLARFIIWAVKTLDKNG